MELPIVDLDLYKKTGDIEECNKAAQSLHEYGVVCLRDSRATQQDNHTFLTMMENYFSTTDFQTDARPEFHYQVGVTPPEKERPRNHCVRATKLAGDNTPVTLCPPPLDKKCRFFWRVGPRPTTTSFQELNAEPVIPSNFPEWETVMNTWGTKMLDATSDLAEMVARGLGLEDTMILKNKMQCGPHLLAPTGSNFNEHCNLNDILAGYHYDLNLMTIHGKARFPGLFIWLKNGTRTPVIIPDGCLLVQAGKQLEYLTGGYIEAGFHEVVISEATLSVINEHKTAGKSLWRVSSTLFSHINSDETLEPLGKFATPESEAKYPPILAGKQVLDELKQIALAMEE